MSAAHTPVLLAEMVRLLAPADGETNAAKPKPVERPVVDAGATPEVAAAEPPRFPPGSAFDACRLVESVAESVGPALGQRAVELVSLVADDVPRMLVGDARRVHRVLVELLDNAVRFTDAGLITIECGWSDGLVMRVTDTGPGIPPIQQARLFEPTSTPRSITT